MSTQQVTGALESRSTLIFLVPASLVTVQNEAAPTLETDSAWVTVCFPSWNVEKEDLVWLGHLDPLGRWSPAEISAFTLKIIFFKKNENGVAKCFQLVPSPDGAKASGNSALKMWNAEKSSSQQWKIQFSLNKKVLWTRPLPGVLSSKTRIILHLMSRMAVAMKGFAPADSSALQQWVPGKHPQVLLCLCPEQQDLGSRHKRDKIRVKGGKYVHLDELREELTTECPFKSFSTELFYFTSLPSWTFWRKNHCRI